MDTDYNIPTFAGRRGSSVSIVTMLWTGLVRFPAGLGIFLSSPQRRGRLWGPRRLLSHGYPGHCADHSPLCSADVKKT
jgi:hypothetical protein